MISINDALWFAEPIPNALHSNKIAEPLRVYVTREILPRTGDSALVGKIVTATKRLHVHEGICYQVDGRIVEGHAVSPRRHQRIDDTKDVLVIFGDNSWGIARFSFMPARSNEFTFVTDVVRSDGVRFPPGVRVKVKDWVPAASWARELMPLAQEPEAVTTKRVAAARYRFLRRRALGVVLREAREREWYEDLVDHMRANGVPLGSPVWHALVSGTGHTPLQSGEITMEGLDEYQQRRVNHVLENVATSSTNIAATIALSVSALDDQPYDPFDENYTHEKAFRAVSTEVSTMVTLASGWAEYPILVDVTETPAA